MMVHNLSFKLGLLAKVYDTCTDGQKPVMCVPNHRMIYMPTIPLHVVAYGLHHYLHQHGVVIITMYFELHRVIDTGLGRHQYH